MRTINQMRDLRDLAGSLPDLLNPLLEPGCSLEYSRFFVFFNDGFGYYPRLRDWSDVSNRVTAFRNAIGHVPEVWLKFLVWWAKANGDKTISTALSGDLSQITDARLYELLLVVMLNTPASWGDRIYWLAHQQKNLSLQPFLAIWRKDEPRDPWNVTVSRFESGTVMEIGQSDITVGSLPDDAADLAPIFWDYLYPLCNRESYAPPQDAAKYATGTISELILPVFGKTGVPLGWAMGNVQAASDPRVVLASVTQDSITAKLNEFEVHVRTITQNE